MKFLESKKKCARGERGRRRGPNTGYIELYRCTVEAIIGVLRVHGALVIILGGLEPGGTSS